MSNDPLIACLLERTPVKHWQRQIDNTVAYGDPNGVRIQVRVTEKEFGWTGEVLLTDSGPETALAIRTFSEAAGWLSCMIDVCAYIRLIMGAGECLK